MHTLISRRAWQGLAGISIASLALTACGPDTTGDSEEEAPGADTEWDDVEPAEEITFWTNHPGSSQDITKELIAEFEEETGISVTVEVPGASYEETSEQVQTSGSDIGDVMVLSDATWYVNYLNGALLSVDEVLEAADVDTSGYVDALYEDYEWEGNHYGAPWARSTPLFYYNVEHYEEAGLDGAPETWEEVQEHSEAIAEAGITDTPFAFPSADSYVSWTMANNVWGWGGGWSDDWDFSIISSEGTVGALEFAQDAVGDWATVSSTDPEDDFAAGSVSHVVASTGSLGGIIESSDFEFETAFLPGGPEEGGDIVPTGGAGLSISAHAEPETQLAAAMFVGFMTSPDATARFSEATGYVPVHTEADMSDVYEETPQFETAVDQLERTRSQDNARVFLPGGDHELSQTLQDILTGDGDVQAELEDLEASLEELYEQELADELDD